MEADMLRTGLFQNAFMEVHHRVRVVHLAGAGRGEEAGALRVVFVRLGQKLHRFLGNGYLPDGVVRLGLGQDDLMPLIVGGLLAHRDGFLFRIQIVPAEGHQLALAQTADQLQIKHGQDAVVLGGLEVGFYALRRQDIHLLLGQLGDDAVLSGIAGNEPFPAGLVPAQRGQRKRRGPPCL